MDRLSRVFLKLAATAFLCAATIFVVFVARAVGTDLTHLPTNLRAIPRWLRMPGWLGIASVATPLVLAGIGVFLGFLADIWRDEFRRKDKPPPF